MMKKDRFLRMVVPSVPVLARTPLASVLDVCDRFLKKKNPRWAHLPPASLRMRIGVGNKILRNHESFIESGNAIVDELEGKGYLQSDAAVLELGCGCGRNAIAMKKYLQGKGRYTGQDVDKEMIDWCVRNIQDESISFHHANVFSKVYNPHGIPVTDYRFPAGDNTLTLIYSISVYSHLLYDDAFHYIRESARTLANNGHLHMTLFILDFMKEWLGDRWTFSHKRGKCYVDSLQYPEAAVAYDLAVLEKMFIQNGMNIVEIYNKDLHQQTVIARKL